MFEDIKIDFTQDEADAIAGGKFEGQQRPYTDERHLSTKQIQQRYFDEGGPTTFQLDAPDLSTADILAIQVLAVQDMETSISHTIDAATVGVPGFMLSPLYKDSIELRLRIAAVLTARQKPELISTELPRSLAA